MSLLHPRTQEIILSAFAENRLAAVHIDLQPCFYPDAPLCHTVEKLSSSLRALNIDNIWVAYAGLHMNAPNGQTTVQTIDHEHASGRRILDSVGASGNDAVVFKDNVSALIRTNTPLQNYLQKTGKDTILVTGVNYDCCVGETIQDAILSDQYNIIAVGDCINIPSQTNAGLHCYARDLFNECAGRAQYLGNAPLPRSMVGDMYQRRFHLTTSDLILQAIAQEKGPS